VAAVALAVAVASVADSAVLPCAVVTVAHPVLTHLGVVDTAAATVAVAVALVAATNLTERTPVGSTMTTRHATKSLQQLRHEDNGIVESSRLEEAAASAIQE
jgi:hypothetical protein